MRFEKGEGLVVAAPLEIVRKLRIEAGRKLRGEGGDAGRNRLEPGEVRRGIALVKFAVSDDGEPFLQRIGKSPQSLG